MVVKNKSQLEMRIEACAITILSRFDLMISAKCLETIQCIFLQILFQIEILIQIVANSNFHTAEMNQQSTHLIKSLWEFRSGNQMNIAPFILHNSQYQQLTTHHQMSNKSSQQSEPSQKTVASTDVERSPAQKCKESKCSKASTKKRIGPYSYYLADTIGQGYSSTVYRGIKDNIKSTSYAIKVINLISMSSAKRKLLDNEISILQSIDHPNILKLLDLFYTENNCYLVTEYCEGGSLQKLIDRGEQLDCGDIAWQIAQGIKYLAKSCIVHRDIKPHNVFLKENTWKIGDFGFAITIPQPAAVLVQNYTIGSPLFMPLQTLESNIYSTKTDSFALGVLIYYLLTKHYPWYSKSKAGLIKSYKSSKLNQGRLKGYCKSVTDIVRKLLRRSVDKRCRVQDIDFSIFLQEGTKKRLVQLNIDFPSIQKKLLVLTSASNIGLQVNICQYIHYLMQNLHLFLPQCHPLFLLLANHLYHLTNLYDWASKGFFNDLRANYFLPLSEIVIDGNQYKYFVQAIQNAIRQLKGKKQNIYQVGLEKILQYYFVLGQVLKIDESQDNSERLIKIISELMLHTQFTNLLQNEDKIEGLLQKAIQNGLISA